MRREPGAPQGEDTHVVMNPVPAAPPGRASYLSWTLPEPPSFRPYSPRPIPSLPGFLTPPILLGWRPKHLHSGGTSAPQERRAAFEWRLLGPWAFKQESQCRAWLCSAFLGSVPLQVLARLWLPRPGTNHLWSSSPTAPAPPTVLAAGTREAYPWLMGTQSGGVSYPQISRGVGTHSLLFWGLRWLPGLRAGGGTCTLPSPMVLEGAAAPVERKGPPALRPGLQRFPRSPVRSESSRQDHSGLTLMCNSHISSSGSGGLGFREAAHSPPRCCRVSPSFPLRMWGEEVRPEMLSLCLSHQNLPADLRKSHREAEPGPRKPINLGVKDAGDTHLEPGSVPGQWLPHRPNIGTQKAVSHRMVDPHTQVCMPVVDGVSNSPCFSPPTRLIWGTG